jgi:2-dehydro-3-deoxy-D-arabinonate dehydratase
MGAMQLCKLRRSTGEVCAAILTEGRVQILASKRQGGVASLSDILHAADPARFLSDLVGMGTDSVPLAGVRLLAPLDRQEVWAAGVTYRRSREARERESQGAARFYDLVYDAPRPELFFKAPAQRVVGPGERLRIRRDSRWSVPEPELALVLSPRLQVVGLTIGNDMSARDIEGENPLYLPQAKIYDGACALGPAITLPEQMPPLDQVSIRLVIQRAHSTIFDGSTSLGKMARSFDDLVGWLGREINFPDGVILLTGTGIVPPTILLWHPAISSPLKSPVSAALAILCNNVGNSATW